ncbi:MAG: YbhB/YbcL family Raf kinase inhibitor-like protein [Methanomicrobiales archaeon]|nr:YbhB/YbcL family Raf kinase inhibitor-like protein [Methanomicrobiales archaeon]
MEAITVRLGFSIFPAEHTCEGGNLSPQIRLKGLNAPSIAIVAVNPYERGCSFCPWAIWNIPATFLIPAGIPHEPIVESPIRAIQGVNDYGNVGYTGPCPPPGETHRYYFKVYGLDTMLDVAPGSNKHDLLHAMRGHVLQFGSTFAMCTR